MLYLLDANVLIDADEGAYPIRQFGIFWEWLAHQAVIGRVRVPIEIYEEISGKRGGLLFDWLHAEGTAGHLIDLPPVSVDLVRTATASGYASDLTDDELPSLGRDPFLIAHCLADRASRCLVTNEGSKPSKTRANRHIPDVCADLGVRCINLFRLVRELDFSTDWRP